MSVADDIEQALNDAIDWQKSLADAHRGCDDGVYERCKAQAQRYRAILKRRYGEGTIEGTEPKRISWHR